MPETTNKEHTLNAKGRERRISELSVVVDRELAKKPSTRGKLTKKRATKRGRKRDARIKKKPTLKNVRVRASPRNGNMKNDKGKNKPNKTPSGKKNNQGKKNDKQNAKKPDGKKNGKGKTKDKNKKDKPPSTANLLFYPNFDIMACVADGIPPPYFSSMYFHTSAHECCAIHFTGVVTECIMKSTGGRGDGGYIIAISQQTTGGVSSGGKSGKSGGEGYSWMGSTGDKSGKSGGGKAGKSVSAEPLSAGTWMGSTGSAVHSNPLTSSLSGSSHYQYGPVMILQTEEPTFYPSYFPTSSPTSMPTTYMPTTYIPT